MIKELLVGKSNTEKATIKAQAIYNAIDNLKANKKTYTFTDGKGRKLTIEDIRLGQLTAKGFRTLPELIAVPIWLKISADGKYLNGDGWYGFVNPPIMTSDGTTREEIDAITGEVIMVDNFKEDIVTVIKNILEQAVR